MPYPPTTGLWGMYSANVYTIGGQSYKDVIPVVYGTSGVNGSPSPSQIAAAFAAIDTNSDGRISWAEFTTFAQNGCYSGTAMTANQAAEIFSYADSGDSNNGYYGAGDSYLSLPEFAQLINQTMTLGN